MKLIKTRLLLKYDHNSAVGVATKYLNNYLIWNNIKNYSLGSVEDKEQIFADFVFTNRFSEKSHDVSKRVAVPV